MLAFRRRTALTNPTPVRSGLVGLEVFLGLRAARARRHLMDPALQMLLDKLPQKHFVIHAG
jgi:hypothetical protein